MAYTNLGSAYRRQGNLDGAIEAYQKAIELDPDDAEAYFNLGVAYRNQGKLDESIQAYKRAIELDPDYVEVYNNLDEAIDAFKEAGES